MEELLVRSAVTFGMYFLSCLVGKVMKVDLEGVGKGQEKVDIRRRRNR